MMFWAFDSRVWKRRAVDELRRYCRDRGIRDRICFVRWGGSADFDAR